MDGEWDRTSYFYIEKVEEAKRLGLSERDCARILNRFSKANVFGPKVDGKSLIIRVQTALKKLGLYKGVLDGNLNSDTRTASKNWQLDNGY